MKNILVLNDLPGYGRVALSASVPILTHMGYRVMNIPTALISNTLDFGKFEILDTTQYMKNTLRIWEELHFTIDAVSIGFLANEEQAVFLTDFCREKKKEGITIICDPIMADHGKLYNGIGPEKVVLMRKLLRYADLCTPNMTEALFLTQAGDFCGYYDTGSVTKEELYALIDKMRDLGVKSVVITSAAIKCNDVRSDTDLNTATDVVAGFDHINNEYFLVPYKKVPGIYPGSGDIFAAFLTGEIMREPEDQNHTKSLKDAVTYSVERINHLIESNKDSDNKHHSLIESFLEDKNAGN